MSSTGNTGLDALADAIAERVIAKIAEQQPKARLLDVAAAAIYLGRSKRSVYAMAANGELPTVEQGSRIMFDRADLDAAIELRKSKR